MQIQAQIGHSETSANNFNLNAAYRGTKANSNFGYGYTKDNQQFYAGMNGGILVHSNGIIFGQQLNSSPILVEAKGAQNIRVENQTGLKIDKNGYAIISSSNAYARNRVALQAEDLGQNISIDDLVKTDIVPTKYAIVKVKFDVKTGHSVLVNLTFKGKELATGTDITEINGLSRVGLVGLNGQAYLTNVESGQTLMAKWGDAVNQQCQFSLPQLSNRAMGYDELTISCEAGEHK